MKKLAILGAGGHGKTVGEAAELTGWDEIVFFDDDIRTVPSSFNWRIAGSTKSLIDKIRQFDAVHVAIGDNSTRRQKTELLKNFTHSFATIIHPSATVSAYALIDEGCMVSAKVVIQADVRIYEGCILNTACSVDHDSSIGAFCLIGPQVGIAGSVSMGSECVLGMNSSVLPGLRMGEGCQIGSGAAVCNDIPKFTIAKGVPAKPSGINKINEKA